MNLSWISELFPWPRQFLPWKDSDSSVLCGCFPCCGCCPGSSSREEENKFFVWFQWWNHFLTRKFICECDILEMLESFVMAGSSSRAELRGCCLKICLHSAAWVMFVSQWICSPVNWRLKALTPLVVGGVRRDPPSPWKDLCATAPLSRGLQLMPKGNLLSDKSWTRVTYQTQQIWFKLIDQTYFNPKVAAAPLAELTTEVEGNTDKFIGMEVTRGSLREGTWFF